eukprot:TRINITY_DN5492_c0_g2_i1.p1 TRINITY_DN5492_c0_g2~~TRINITY_DN5492_c0_g2_i1.p1  ORF type:complete len:449 (+),score=109.60 TRINITY_DN5492_c0_g2_i1:25-1347(+)
MASQRSWADSLRPLDTSTHYGKQSSASGAADMYTMLQQERLRATRFQQQLKEVQSELHAYREHRPVGSVPALRAQLQDDVKQWRSTVRAELASLKSSQWEPLLRSLIDSFERGLQLAEDWMKRQQDDAVQSHRAKLVAQDQYTQAQKRILSLEGLLEQRERQLMQLGRASGVLDAARGITSTSGSFVLSRLSQQRQQQSSLQTPFADPASEVPTGDTPSVNSVSDFLAEQHALQKGIAEETKLRSAAEQRAAELQREVERLQGALKLVDEGLQQEVEITEAADQKAQATIEQLLALRREYAAVLNEEQEARQRTERELQTAQAQIADLQAVLRIERQRVQTVQITALSKSRDAASKARHGMEDKVAEARRDRLRAEEALVKQRSLHQSVRGYLQDELNVLESELEQTRMELSTSVMQTTPAVSRHVGFAGQVMAADWQGN